MIKSLRTLFLLSIFSVLYTSCSKDSDEAVPDTVAPTVNFAIKGITPTNSGQPPIIGNTIEIEISAQDAKGISKVEAFMNDSKVGSDEEAPFKITIDLSQFAKKLIGKGTVISKTQTQYTLKVAATDLSGNVGTMEQEIIVDNELPTITEVSLENNAVIGGVANLLTFKAEDNQETLSLEVKVNDFILETTVVDSVTYRINIDTALLEDGQNQLSITVSDQASNTATYNAPFLVDNTGPEITLEGLSNNSILDENTLTVTFAEDQYSEIDSLKIFINDSLVLSGDTPVLNLELKPDDYDTGATILKIRATDALGNESIEEVTLQIKRLLLKINVPSGFLDPTLSAFYVFASDSLGEVLDIKPLEYNTSEIKLNTFVDITPDTEYMLNFAYLFRSGGEKSFIKTIQNVKRSTMDRMDLKNPEPVSATVKNTYQASELQPGVSIQGEGSDYHSQYDYLHGNGYVIDDYNIDNPVSSQEYYIYYFNALNNNYGYQLLEKPLNVDFFLDFDNFITAGVETRYFNGSAIQDPADFTEFVLYGYLNATDFDNAIKHKIWALKVDNASFMNGSGYRYDFNTNFHSYSYIATMENYRIEAMGEPLSYYTAPDWSIDYTYSSTTKTFSINQSGTSHTIGKIYMNLMDTNSFYTWIVLFDSQTSSDVLLPKLPQELQSWNINNYYENGPLNVEQIEVKKYEGLDTYDAFLQTVIKSSVYKQQNVSDKMESVFKSNVGSYISRPDFSFFFN